MSQHFAICVDSFVSELQFIASHLISAPLANWVLLIISPIYTGLLITRKNRPPGGAVMEGLVAVGVFIDTGLMNRAAIPPFPLSFLSLVDSWEESILIHYDL